VSDPAKYTDGARHPNIEVQIIGFPESEVIDKIAAAMREAGVNQEEITQFRIEARNGNKSILGVAMDWVTIY